MKSIALHGLFAIALISLNLLVSASALAEVAVIVHPDNHNKLTARDIARIYLGKKKTFPDGARAIPIDQSEDSLVRAVFNANVLNKSSQRLKTYWAELLFTGRGTPPEEVGRDDAVKTRVSQNPSIIGYIDASNVDDSVRVVYSF
ncbi:MAG: phosphate ABC transporter substrate-binding protein [Exilibacterium sp.]